MADVDSWDADSFEPEEAVQKAAVRDKWEGEDEDDDVKDNWDDDEEEKQTEDKTTVEKPPEKKKLSDIIKEKESLQRQKQEELKKQFEESEPTPDEKLAENLRVKQLQEDSELTQEAFGVALNNVTGIDALSPSSKEDFTEFERLLKDKLSPYEKSIHYSSLLESLFRDLCLSLEIDDLKKINNSLTVLLAEKQKQEKQNKGKKKKKGVLPGGGLKAKMKDDLADYGEFGGGYAQDYEDFM